MAKFRQLRDLQRAQQSLIERLGQESHERKEAQSRLVEFESNIPVFEKARNELQKWKQKEPQIRHYLKVFNEMAE